MPIIYIASISFGTSFHASSDIYKIRYYEPQHPIHFKDISITLDIYTLCIETTKERKAA
jgi:hypothetical protein